MKRPRAVLFDLGQVLVRFDWTNALREWAERVPGGDVETLAEWIHGPEGPHDLYCTGRLDDRGLLDAIHARFDPAHEIDDAWIIARWNSIFTSMPGAEALLDTLRGQCRLGLVSNTNRLHFEYLDTRMRLRERFDVLGPSHEVGTLKPDPRIWEVVLEGLECDAHEAFFVDDIEEFVEAARGLGIDAHRFGGIEGLRTLLRERGLHV